MRTEVEGVRDVTRSPYTRVVGGRDVYLSLVITSSYLFPLVDAAIGMPTMSRRARSPHAEVPRNIVGALAACPCPCLGNCVVSLHSLGPTGYWGLLDEGMLKDNRMRLKGR
jgi:hypothetical protein